MGEMKVLVLFAHPAFHKSRVNKALVAGLSAIEGLKFHDLYEAYPDYYIDVKREQELLLEHDLIVLHFPLFWYSTPALLKEWQDLVLEHGWAYGSKGNALAGKRFMCSITTGGPESAYQVEGFHGHTLNQLLAPLRQTAKLCKMQLLPPLVLHGTHAVEMEKVEAHRKNYHDLLKNIIQGNLDWEGVDSLEYFNHHLKA